MKHTARAASGFAIATVAVMGSIVLTGGGSGGAHQGPAAGSTATLALNQEILVAPGTGGSIPTGIKDVYYDPKTGWAFLLHLSKPVGTGLKAEWKTAGSRLVVTDITGKSLWQYDPDWDVQLLLHFDANGAILAGVPMRQGTRLQRIQHAKPVATVDLPSAQGQFIYSPDDFHGEVFCGHILAVYTGQLFYLLDLALQPVASPRGIMSTYAPVANCGEDFTAILGRAPGTLTHIRIDKAGKGARVREVAPNWRVDTAQSRWPLKDTIVSVFSASKAEDFTMVAQPLDPPAPAEVRILPLGSRLPERFAPPTIQHPSFSGYDTISGEDSLAYVVPGILWGTLRYKAGEAKNKKDPSLLPSEFRPGWPILASGFGKVLFHHHLICGYSDSRTDRRLPVCYDWQKRTTIRGIIPRDLLAQGLRGETVQIAPELLLVGSNLFRLPDVTYAGDIRDRVPALANEDWVRCSSRSILLTEALETIATCQILEKEGETQGKIYEQYLIWMNGTRKARRGLLGGWSNNSVLVRDRILKAQTSESEDRQALVWMNLAGSEEARIPMPPRWSASDISVIPVGKRLWVFSTHSRNATVGWWVIDQDGSTVRDPQTVSGGVRVNEPHIPPPVFLARPLKGGSVLAVFGKLITNHWPPRPKCPPIYVHFRGVHDPEEERREREACIKKSEQWESAISRTRTPLRYEFLLFSGDGELRARGTLQSEVLGMQSPGDIAIVPDGTVVIVGVRSISRVTVTAP
jgi:hypothetical protein